MSRVRCTASLYDLHVADNVRLLLLLHCRKSLSRSFPKLLYSPHSRSRSTLATVVATNRRLPNRESGKETTRTPKPTMSARLWPSASRFYRAVLRWVYVPEDFSVEADAQSAERTVSLSVLFKIGMILFCPYFLLLAGILCCSFFSFRCPSSRGSNTRLGRQTGYMRGPKKASHFLGVEKHTKPARPRDVLGVFALSLRRTSERSNPRKGRAVNREVLGNTTSHCITSHCCCAACSTSHAGCGVGSSWLRYAANTCSDSLDSPRTLCGTLFFFESCVSLPSRVVMD